MRCRLCHQVRLPAGETKAQSLRHLGQQAALLSCRLRLQWRPQPPATPPLWKSRLPLPAHCDSCLPPVAHSGAGRLQALSCAPVSPSTCPANSILPFLSPGTPQGTANGVAPSLRAPRKDARGLGTCAATSLTVGTGQSFGLCLLCWTSCSLAGALRLFFSFVAE